MSNRHQTNAHDCPLAAMVHVELIPDSVLQICASETCIVVHVFIIVSHRWWTQITHSHGVMPVGHTCRWQPSITTFCQEQNCHLA